MTEDRGTPDQRSSKPSERRTIRQGNLNRREPSARRKPARVRSDLKASGQEAVVVKPLTHFGKRLGDTSHTMWEWLAKDWKVPVAISLAITGGVTALSIGFLLKLPAVPNCPAVFWPLASGSLRLHCAQLAAGKRTVNDLLEAIQLLSTLPPDHPLHDEAARLTEEWSKDILDLATEAFNAGKLDDAIRTARKVPKMSSVHAQVEGQIKRWQAIWSQAEKLYSRAEDALRKENWRQASTEAARLLSIDNTFWQTTKYQELTEKIASAREDMLALAKARNLFAQGGLKNLLEAIKLASGVNDKSYVFQAAQGVIAQTGRKMFDLAETTLNQRDLNSALDIARQIPTSAKLQKEVEDFEKLASAQSKTWNGSEADFDAAIAEAQRIEAGRPLHDKAQQLIARWQIEKEDVSQLARVRELAQSGRPEDLQAAIANAAQIPSSNPRSAEAQKLVEQLTSDMQTKQDRPILERAEQIASLGDAASLQSAITEVEQISSGRSLFAQAQSKRQQWQRQLRQLQEQERALATPPANGTESASQPSSGGSAIGDAQSAQSQEVQADQQTLETARNTANGGTISDYASAIRLADGVPARSPVRSQAQQFMNQLSQQIYQAARSQADFDVLGAIAAAESIPPGTEAYPQAQQFIRSLKRNLGQQ